MRRSRRSPRVFLSPLAFGSGSLFVSLFVAVVVVVGGASEGTGASRDRRFFSAREGVGIEAPAGWALSLHTGYPEILCVLLHPDGSRISLSAAPTKAADAKALVEQSRRGLEAQHFAIARVGTGPPCGVAFDARAAGSGAELRQLYLVRPAGAGRTQAIVLTLSTRAATLAADGPAFDSVVAHLALETPTGAEEPRPDAGVSRLGAPDGGPSR
jgi:hypothetical protein